MIIKIDEKNVFVKIQHSNDKNLQKNKNRRELLQMNINKETNE